MIWTMPLSGTDIVQRLVTSPKRHLRGRKIFWITVEQLHPIGMTACPDVPSVRVNKQVIDERVQLQRLSNTERKQEKERH